MTTKKDMSRRGFLKVTGWAATVAGLGVLAVPVIGYYYPGDLSEVPADPVPVGTPEELPVGTARLVSFGRYPALVIHTDEGLKAYSAVCTHFACLVKWDPDLGQIVCPCHDGYFDPLDGSVLAGPPPRALDTFSAYIAEDGLIYVGAEENEEAS